MEREVDINKVLAKLLAFYKEKYPHNPQGVLLLHLSKLGLKGLSAILVLASNKGIEVSGLKEIVEERRPLKARLNFDLIKELKLEKIIDELELKEEEILYSKKEEQVEEILEKEEKELTELVSELKQRVQTVDVGVLKGAIEQLIDLMDKSEVKYILLKDTSVKAKFDNLIRAINFLAKNGWKCLGTYPTYVTFLTGGYSLMLH